MSQCEACGQPFTATRATARFCSTACRQRAHRDRQAAEAEPAGDGPLVAALRGDLATSRQLDTTLGQLAVQLARGIERRPSAGLSRQLREVLGDLRFRAAQGRR
jgi:hypothetical protein